MRINKVAYILFVHNFCQSHVLTIKCSKCWGEGAGSSCNTFSPGLDEAYRRAKWHLDPSSRLARIDGLKMGGCWAPFLGELLWPYQNLASPLPFLFPPYPSHHLLTPSCPLTTPSVLPHPRSPSNTRFFGCLQINMPNGNSISPVVFAGYINVWRDRLHHAVSRLDIL